MNLYWSNWSDFWAMGGYGLYVWGSFGASVLVIALELLSLRQRRKALHSQVEASS
jgi:heme exporter protein D